MNFLRRAFGINNEASVSVPDAPSKPPLTQQEVDDIVKDFLIEGRPSPTNQQIAEKLGRTIEEVNVLRPPGPYLHTRYDSDGENEAITEKMEILNKPIGSQGGRKNHKTISNKNKKKYKKLSRRRRHHHSKKNRKSMKRK
jgi:hypothetical protein